MKNNKRFWKIFWVCCYVFLTLHNTLMTSFYIYIVMSGVELNQKSILVFVVVSLATIVSIPASIIMINNLRKKE